MNIAFSHSKLRRTLGLFIIVVLGLSLAAAFLPGLAFANKPSTILEPNKQYQSGQANSVDNSQPKELQKPEEKSLFDKLLDFPGQGAELLKKGWDWAKDTAGKVWDGAVNFGKNVWDWASKHPWEALAAVGLTAALVVGSFFAAPVLAAALMGAGVAFGLNALFQVGLNGNLDWKEAAVAGVFGGLTGGAMAYLNAGAGGATAFADKFASGLSKFTGIQVTPIAAKFIIGGTFGAYSDISQSILLGQPINWKHTLISIGVSGAVNAFALGVDKHLLGKISQGHITHESWQMTKAINELQKESIKKTAESTADVIVGTSKETK